MPEAPQQRADDLPDHRIVLHQQHPQTPYHSFSVSYREPT